ncbi:response regulator [candidate division KSB1 bacterium]|nr:response regulator [candidate division KSB1 bacterium]
MEAKKILVLEDDESVAQLLKFYLEEEGYTVKITQDIKSFRMSLEEETPDLISLDILLPDGDGFKVFEELKQNDRTKSIPVVFVTVREADKEKGIKMGAQGFIAKPFAEDEFKDTISQALRGKPK